MLPCYLYDKLRFSILLAMAAMFHCCGPALAAYPQNYLSEKLGVKVLTAAKLTGPFKPNALLSDGPIELPANWAGLLRKNFSHRELGRIENSVKRGAPFGDDRWREMTALKLKLESTLRPKGRPKTCAGHL